jgi:hypothetical protein
MRLSELTSREVNELFREAAAIRGQSTVEGVAQKFTELLYHWFEESFILTRLFATVPFGRLPAPNQDFVRKLAESAGIAEALKGETMVLSLMGTSGRAPEWNDRHRSKGHVGIPLVSSKFVDSIPMISRLLKEIGLDLDWIDDWGAKIVSKGFLSKSTGMFYVENAGAAEDQDKRKIISAQDFVSSYDVKSVFGFGSGFHANPTLVAFIAFTGETLSSSAARPLITVMEGFKRAAMESVIEERFFE